jgi:hypothetical protein
MAFVLDLFRSQNTTDTFQETADIELQTFEALGALPYDDKFYVISSKWLEMWKREKV